ncbi:hypothetical protein C8A03DRAFT_16432 [Achaetomium macrosporum]|uniref:RNA-binding S4 domain-containing protein n=1 Tax=Achaetomium macrosporum TaxID=79813 RepID=A0AAN7C7Q7_9PEZI|nr:hypothetical protein C8A03DRAFT_16432 [Achaetomium macrosporum]
MRHRRLLRFHGLKRPRVRQTWNKYNLFNLLRLRTPLLQSKTFFQQKWIAKSMTRGYHGEHIKEYKWERMFSRRPLSAVNMDPTYMAKHNGSEQASGRGSGVSNLQVRNKGNFSGMTPYMQMVFAPMERRLDIAIFRALFASSARQARQFVIHGAVTVNGKKMRHPGYLLNPGDMFQVDIERVMTATGQPKRPSQNQKALPSSESSEEPAEDGGEAEAEGAATEAAEGATEGVDVEAAKKNHMKTLSELKERAKKIMAVGDKRIQAKHKKQLRKFLRQVKVAMDSSRKQSVSEMTSVEEELSSLLSDLSLTPAERKAKAEAEQEQEAATSSDKPRLNEKQRAVLAELIAREAENPHDPSKPYATPWRPRDWMSPFAFIPRYLEVNQRICAAVYLRHPVARPGRSEVPSPFSPTLSQLAFNWYLRRS